MAIEIRSPSLQESVVDGTGASGRTERRVPMTQIRARIAERLLDAKQGAAMLTTFNEVDMQPIMHLHRILICHRDLP